MKNEKKITVTLLKDHEHEGKKRKKGAKISVCETDRQWLKEHGVIK